MKKGFTLIELVGVLVILSLIITFAYPIVINVLKDQKEKTSDYEKEMVFNAARLYIENSETKPNCINISDLKKGKYLRDVSVVEKSVSVIYDSYDITFHLEDNSCN